MVNLEWELSATASKTNDNISKLAIKSISESASCIQTSISKLISTEINLAKEQNYSGRKENKNIKMKILNCKHLKRVVLNKK